MRLYQKVLAIALIAMTLLGMSVVTASASGLKVGDLGQVSLSSGTLNVRKGANGTTILGVLGNGTIIKVLAVGSGSSSGWYRISVETATSGTTYKNSSSDAWVSNSFIKKAPSTTNWQTRYTNVDFIVSNTKRDGVANLQKDLNAWAVSIGRHTGTNKFSWYKLGEDGIFGSVSSNATKDFQRAMGLSVDGVAGPKTKEALYNVTQ
jgi:peptidoglycan hydrolase-like protein with peptidoglycan-binding domain